MEKFVYFSPRESLFNFHPHVHVLVMAGIINDGIFYKHTNISTKVILET